MVEFILYVANQEISRQFYSTLLDKAPDLHVPGMTEFTLNEHCKLGLIPEKNIARIINPALPDPASGNGIPRCELYIYTDNVEDKYKRLLIMNATEVSPLQDRDWGDRVCYFSDPDGHVIAFAEKI